jgi:hypothetical protein
MKKITLLALFIAVGFAGLAGSGCRTFNWTREDSAEEQRQVYQGGFLVAPRAWDLKRTEIIR